MLDLDFPEKHLGLVSPTHFAFDFLRKIFGMFYSINKPNFIAWLPLLLETLENKCIVIIFFPVYDLINFENNLSFPIKLFFYMPKSGQRPGQKF